MLQLKIEQRRARNRNIHKFEKLFTKKHTVCVWIHKGHSILIKTNEI